MYSAKNKTSTKFQIFDQNHGLTPLEKYQFSECLKPMFSLFTQTCLVYKTSKIVFLRFILTIYDMRIAGVTRNYRWLQGVTRGEGGYNGLQGVTTGYWGLQGVTGGYKGL